MSNRAADIIIRSTINERLKPPSERCKTIAFVCNNAIGLQLFRGAIMQKLVDKGYTVYAITPHGSQTFAFISAGIKFLELRLATHGMNPIVELLTVTKLRGLYKKIKPDLIFHYTIKLNIYGTIASNSLSIPSLAIVAGLGTFPDVKSSLLKSLLFKGYQYASRKSSEIWFLNEHDYGFFEAKGFLREATPRIIPGEGVDTTYYAYTPLQPKKRLKALFVGRLLKTKGVTVFVEAAKRAAREELEIDFELMGFIEEHNPDGVSTAQVHEWHSKRYINYLGTTTDVRPAIQEADIVVLPTQYREGLSRSLLEALSIGRPIITSGLPGAGILVDHLENGYIVPTNNPDAIISALTHYSRLQVEQREDMSRKCRKKAVTNFSLERILPHYYDVINRKHLD